ncbi:MAG: M48 family metallopeptidase [Blautia sp.]|nr:M48 family metallopeptidase [Blautia sp.]
MHISFDDVEVVRSYRKTIGLEVKADGRVLVRAPVGFPEADIRRFVEDHQEWIRKHLKKVQEKAAQPSPADRLSMDEIRALAEKAQKIIPDRVEHYAKLVGVTYGRITIRNQKSRWGSCSAKGNLNFNCLLMLTPPEVIDSVVVHELCHRKEMNHSKKFYEEVLRVYPEYRKWERWLKDNGGRIMRRMTG